MRDDLDTRLHDPHGTVPLARQQQRARHAHLAQLSARLLAAAPRTATGLSWALLQASPDWLGWPDEQLLALQRRVGAVFCAPALRLWIEAPRVRALRTALGEGFHHALVTRSDRVRAATLPPALPEWPLGPAPLEAEPAAQLDARVAELLSSCGAAVLVCTLPHGALRHAAHQALGPLAELMMPASHAQALVELALTLGTEVDDEAGFGSNLEAGLAAGTGNDGAIA